MPAISVIVPVFNSRPFLDRCLASILNQTFTDFEAILVDDASSDRSDQVVEQFSRNDARIRLVRHRTNLGPGGARNTGISKARASYLTFIDSDDFVDPNFLELLFNAADKGRFDIVESGCRAIDEDEELLWEYSPTPAKYTDLETKGDSILLMRELAMHQKLWRRTLFTENNIRFPEGALWEDVAVIPALIVCARSLTKVDIVAYNYLQRANSITSTRSAKHIADLFGAFEYFRTFLARRHSQGKYAVAFRASVTNTVSYFSKHMQSQHLSNPALSRKLACISEIVAIEYLADCRIIERIRPERLKEVIEKTLELNFDQPTTALHAAIRRNLEANGVT